MVRFVYIQTPGWMDDTMDGWKDGQMDNWMDGWLNEGVDQHTGKWMNGQAKPG